MSVSDIRDDIIDELKTIPGLGGQEQKIWKFFYESDDVVEARKFWESTEPSPSTDKHVNAVMLRRTGREDREKVAGKEFAMIHSFTARFRYGKGQDPNTEETFEGYLEAIMDKLRNNVTIFKRDGLHPEDDGSQSASVTIVNKPLFHVRVWEADISFVVVERIFC